MKSFNQHSDKKSENLQEDPFDDLTDLLWVGAAGAGLWGLSKGWDKFGKDAVASLPFASDKMKAGKAQRKIDKADAKAKDKETIAKGDEMGIKNVKDAQAFFDKHGKSPAGYQEYPEKSKTVMAVDDIEKEKERKAKEDETKAKIDKSKQSGQAKKQAKGKLSLGKVDKGKQAALKAKLKAKKASAGKEEFQKFALQELKSLTEEDKTQLLGELILEETMTITESNELQAIMALDDAGIKAEINRKGQVVIKKKDKKKAHIALEKSFKKGGWPTLKLEEVEIDEASNKKAMKKVADELEAIADKGGAEAPALFSMASRLRKGQLPTGQKVSKKVSAIFKKHGIREELRKPRTSYEIVSEARKRAATNKPKWEPEDSEPRLS
jgi:murein DD-endopeptidase MepM/ murein hydrolase activator NlpD